MTSNISGIDIRKALLKAGLIPSHYNEQGIFDDAVANHIDDWEIEGEIATLAANNRA